MGSGLVPWEWAGVEEVAEVHCGACRHLDEPCFSSPDMDATYRPMYASDVPLDPLDMHMDMDGDYPMDTYSDGLRPPYPTADHMLA